MAYENILYETKSKIATITLNRPQALNAMTLALMDDVNDAFDKAAADPDVRVIVLTGSGRGFCSGADLATSTMDPPRDAEGRIDLGQILERWYEPMILKMHAMDKPIIAGVNGIAAGAGCSLALNADLTIAAQSAKFLQAFVNVGLVPDAGGTWLLPHMTTLQRAMGMALLGEKITADQAHAWGLIWQVVPDADLAKSVQAIAEKLANGPALALAGIKRALHSASTNDLKGQLALERDLQRDCGRSEDFIEGAMAFLQKRPAAFKGR
jgi:2-(1,2-epoxy-1,2-dihydrophenyl)acetyl-CoA isomerase